MILSPIQQDQHSVSLSFPFIFIQSFSIIFLIGCSGTTRLLGAGAVDKKNGALFGPPDEKFITKTIKSSSAKSLKDKINKDFHYQDNRKKPTPTLDDKPIYGIRSNKNFIVANAVEAILQGKLTWWYLLWSSFNNDFVVFV